MQTIGHASWRTLLVALLVSGPTGPAGGQERTASATQQYSAAVALQNRGDFRPAAEQWVKFIDTFKTDSRCDRAFHYLGLCYLKTNQLELARQCFEIVVKHYPKFELLDATYYCLGSTLYNLGRSGKAELYDAAADAFQSVISKYPQSELVSQALFHRGECFYHRGKKQEAAETYAQRLAKFPGDKLAADVLYALGVSQEELGQDAEAGKSYERFLEKYGQNSLAAEVTVRRAALLAQERKYRPSGRPVRLGFGQVAAVEAAGRGRPGRRKVLLPGRRLRRGPKDCSPRPWPPTAHRSARRPIGWCAAC